MTPRCINAANIRHSVRQSISTAWARPVSRLVTIRCITAHTCSTNDPAGSKSAPATRSGVGQYATEEQLAEAVAERHPFDSICTFAAQRDDRTASHPVADAPGKPSADTVTTDYRHLCRILNQPD